MCDEHLTKRAARRWVGLFPLIAVAAAGAACNNARDMMANRELGRGGPSFNTVVTGAGFRRR